VACAYIMYYNVMQMVVYRVENTDKKGGPDPIPPVEWWRYHYRRIINIIWTARPLYQHPAIYRSSRANIVRKR